MWSDFTLSNFHKLKSSKKKKSIDINCLYFQKINEQLNKIKLIPIFYNYKIKKICIFKKILPKLVLSRWIDNNLLNNIDNLDSEYLIKWNKNKIYLRCTQDKFIKIKKRLPYLLRMINFLNNTNENITIFLLLSNLKKKLDNNEIIGPANINSGYTHIVDRYIFIWREEEFEKVLFHEIIHFYNHDHRSETYTNFLNFENLHEAITDFKAISFNLIYLSLITNIKIQDLINFEFSFIYNQAIMINNLINNNIKLESPAFSYYVLKYMLLNYIISNEFSLKEYNNLFINHKNFNNIINKLKKINETEYLNFNSCRMTLFELE